MRHLLIAIALFGICTLVLAEDAPKNLLSNGSFEEQAKDWVLTADNDMSKVVADAAKTGKLGLRVTDESDTLGSSAGSQKIASAAGKSYKLTCQARVVSGNGIGLYLQFSDKDGKQLLRQELNNQATEPIKGADWAEYTVTAKAPENAAFVRAWIHSYTKNKVVADVDDVVLVETK